MNEMLPCPGCSTPLPPEATGCQICMRARTKQEIVRGYAYLREEKARRKALPFKIAGAVIVVAITAKLSWDNRARIVAAAQAGRDYAAKRYEKFTDAKTYAPKEMNPEPAPVNPADLPKTDPQSPFAPKPPAPVLPKYVVNAQGSGPGSGEAGRGGGPPPPDIPEAAPRKTEPPAKTDWRVSGLVYDMTTLEPVLGAEVVFLRDGGEPVTAVTGSDGTYEADIAKGDGWTVELRSPYHRRGQVLDVDPPYRQRDADERRAAFTNLTEGDLIPAPVSWKRARSKAVLDIVAVPERWNGR